MELVGRAVCARCDGIGVDVGPFRLHGFLKGYAGRVIASLRVTRTGGMVTGEVVHWDLQVR